MSLAIATNMFDLWDQHQNLVGHGTTGKELEDIRHSLVDSFSSFSEIQEFLDEKKKLGNHTLFLWMVLYRKATELSSCCNEHQEWLKENRPFR